MKYAQTLTLKPAGSKTPPNGKMPHFTRFMACWNVLHLKGGGGVGISSASPGTYAISGGTRIKSGVQAAAHHGESPPPQPARVWTSASARTVPAGCGSDDQDGVGVDGRHSFGVPCRGM